MLFDNFEAKSKPPLFYSLCVDSGDEYWDCSSNDADDLNSDSDIDENGTLAQRQQRQLYINKVSECFSNSFGGNTQSNAITSVSGPPTRKEEGKMIHTFKITQQYMTNYIRPC